MPRLYYLFTVPFVLSTLPKELSTFRFLRIPADLTSDSRPLLILSTYPRANKESESLIKGGWDS